MKPAYTSMVIHGNRNSVEEKNAVLIALFIFQYALTIPLMSRISSSIIIGVTSSILILISFFYNRYINSSVLLFAFIIAGIFSIKTFMDGFVSPDLMIHFFIFVLPSTLMMMHRYDSEKLLNTCYKLAILNFFILLPNPFMAGYLYMRFGYGMILTTIYTYIYIPKLHGLAKLFAVAISIVSLGETLLYGARGALVVFILFLCTYMFLIRREKIIRNAALVSLFVLIYFNLDQIIELAYILSKRVGVGSYAIKKYRMQMAAGLAYASSGRDRLYQRTLEAISEHPIFGNRIENIGEDVYAHNLFLQIGQDFGIPMVIVLVCVLISVVLMIAYKKNEYNDRLLLCCLFSVSVGRLMFSSVVYERPEFWLMLALFVSISFKDNSYIFDIKGFS